MESSKAKDVAENSRTWGRAVFPLIADLHYIPGHSPEQHGFEQANAGEKETWIALR
jgi:hypothetical protein